MKATLAALVICLSIAYAYGASEKLECYTCDPVTMECEASKATPIQCGANAQCQKRWKKGATSMEKVLRQCVVPDLKTGSIFCPDGFECLNCKEKLCNGAVSMHLAWISLVCVAFGLLF